MADEKRRLIYELLVEAKGMDGARKEMEKLGQYAEKFAAGFSKIGTGLAVTFTLKGIAEALSEANVMQAQLGTLGLSAEQAADGLTMVEDISIRTGSSMQDANSAFMASVQVIQQLGGTMSDAAKAGEAFVKIAESEGKSASAAAEQINALNFALQKGEVSSKELVTMLKSSNVMQEAFASATGKTVQQLVEMAKQGEITRDVIAAVFAEMVKIGEHTEIPLTLDGIINSFTTMAKSIVNATASAAGFGRTSGQIYGPLNVLANMLRALAATAGSVVNIFYTLVKSTVDIATALAYAVLHPTEALATLDTLSQKLKDNWKDVQDSLADTRERWVAIGTGATETQVKLNNAHADEMRNLDEAAKAEEKRLKSFKEAQKYSEQRKREFAEEEAARAKAARAAEKAERDRIDRERRAEDRFREQLAENRAANEDLNAYLEREAEEAGQRAAESAAEGFEAGLPAFEKSLDATLEEIAQFADVLKNAFSDLFAGGIRNAREFFQVLLQGFAQVFAQRAAMKLNDWIDKGIDALLAGGWGKSADDIIEAVPIPSARGNVFSGGQKMAFASGGIVSRPTKFAMGYGGTGLMGEAGPEAIMPLKRGADGKLGVSASAPTVQIINNTGVAATGRTEQHNDRLTIILEAAQMGASMAEERINRSVRSGYGATAQSVQRTYGLTRRQ